MNSKIISASQPTLNLCREKHNISQLQSLPSQLPFNKPNFSSLKTSSKTFRFRLMAASTAVNYAVATSTSTESFYDLLGISESGSISDVKKAYKKMALKYHADVSPPERTEEYTRKFIRVQEAYQTLSDPKTRAMYDSDMANGFNLDFSGRKGVRFDPRSEDMSVWQSQIVELKKKSMMKNNGGKVTWGARIRNRNREPFLTGSIN